MHNQHTRATVEETSEMAVCRLIFSLRLTWAQLLV